MKILQINSVCGFGSTGRIATDLYKVYEEAGYECIIAYGRKSAPSGYKTIKIGNNLDNYMHIIKTRISDRHGFGSKKATEDFIKKVEKYNPDVIHLHNIHGYYINIDILFSYLKKANKKVIWTLHDCWSFTGHCSYFDYAKCEQWKQECCNCSQKKEYPTSIYKSNAKWNFNNKKDIFKGIKDMTLVTPSKWLAELVKKSFLKEYKVKVINNGIDLEVFKPSKSNFRIKHKLNDEKLILGVASIWDKRKGLDCFIKLSKEISKDYKIVLVGVNEKQIKEFNENIIGIERTNNINELAEIYSEAFVFLNPTREDNFPTTNMEALACGAPVVTFNTGGSIEVIEADNGFVIEKEEEILETLKKLETIKKEKVVNTSKKYDKQKKFKEYIGIIN